ncbi:hypothetical protein RRG08_061982 [Elysia crispata]|uniref:Uncharacterized protein n=1 Tax=Elysia crispata TaxID=231223 RepID=A0AAE1DRH1_9GAST|nr:hypothetical protein RRG08_061982 [Elysia crispata]
MSFVYDNKERRKTASSVSAAVRLEQFGEHYVVYKADRDRCEVCSTRLEYIMWCIKLIETDARCAAPADRGRCEVCSTRSEYINVVYKADRGRCEVCSTRLENIMWCIKLIEADARCAAPKGSNRGLTASAKKCVMSSFAVMKKTTTATWSFMKLLPG